MLLSFWPRHLYFFPKSAVKRFPLLPAAALRQTDVCLSVCLSVAFVRSGARSIRLRGLGTCGKSGLLFRRRRQWRRGRSSWQSGHFGWLISSWETRHVSRTSAVPSPTPPRLWSMGHLWPGLLIYKMTQSSLCRCCWWYAQYARQKPANPPVWRARPALQYSE